MGGKATRSVAMELSRGCPYIALFVVPMQQHQHVPQEKNIQITQELKKKTECLTIYHREKPIPKFIEEVKKAQEKYSLNFIYFTDESFLSMRNERFEEFINSYEKIKVPFFIESRVETIKPGYAKELEKVGCAGVAMGVESGSIELRKLEKTNA